ncbi:TRAP transporter large permease [Arcobacter sp. KX21116]|uniref:TRAP transporter large permease n=1 Tax=Arcobacter iocasae TaxID=2906515 RepID=UPI0035D50A7E
MSPLEIALLLFFVTLVVLASGVPIAFGLGFVAVVFLYFFDGPSSLLGVGEMMYESLSEFALIAIPMFILMGTAVSSSPTGKDLYKALDSWLYRIPGGLVIANIGACTIFSALSGSSPATCAAIGKMGIPEMQKKGYPDAISTGSIAAGGTLGILIPPSVTMIVYGVATETSIGRLFVAGVVPGILLSLSFMAWSIFYVSRHNKKNNINIKLINYTFMDKLKLLPKVLPFGFIVFAILYILYGGLATPSEASGVGALFCLIFVVLIYKMWNIKKIWNILKSSMRESTMIMLIIGASALFSYTLSSLYITQSIAEWITLLGVNKWFLLAIINIFLLVAGFFLPPVAVILMTAPILIPIITSVGFDPYWFAVILTINMEIGLITPPVGLNLYVINGITPNVSLPTILKGALPFVIIMMLSIVLFSIFPEIVTWLPDKMMGQIK